MPETPTPSSPDFSKVGFGAMGNVEVKHDASQHSHHEDKSQHSHVHYHMPPATPPGQPPETRNASGGHHGSGGNHNYTIKIVFSLGGLGLLFWFLKQPQHQPVPVVLPPIHIENKINSDNHGSTLIKGSQNGVNSPTQIQAPAPANTQTIRVNSQPPSLPPVVAPPTGLHVTFDRADRVYHDKDKQALHITVPKRGYLYAASVWADGQMRILCHPALLTPSPGPVEAGQTVEIPTINMSFTPPEPSAAITEEEIRVVLSDTLLPGIPSERRMDIRPSWEAALSVVVGSPHQRMRVRGGELPLPEPSTLPTTGILQHTAPYRMIRGPRPVSAQ